MNDGDYDYDVLVIGSGFGGSVTALRLTEKVTGSEFSSPAGAGRGLTTQVELERAQVDLGAEARAHRTAAHQHPRQVPRVQRGRGRRWLDHLRQHAAPAARPVLPRQAGAHIAHWKAELAPDYDQANRMLGVNPNPRLTPADEVVKQIADDSASLTRFMPPTSVSSSTRATRARRSPTRTSGAPGRAERGVSTAPAASPAARTTRRTRC